MAKSTVGLETRQVAELAGVKLPTLDYWTRTGLVSPSIRGSQGHRITRLWTIQDAVEVRVIKALRDSGCSVKRIRKAKRVLNERWGESLANVVLYWDGRELFSMDAWGRVKGTLRHPGQLALHLTAMPITRWRREVERYAVEIDFPTPRRTRSSRGQRRAHG
jgi:DNA-binding transcriptional MerR regulator